MQNSTLVFSMCLAVLGFWMKMCSGTANIQIQLLSHDNPKHRLSNGRCCEEGLEKDCQRNGKGRCITCTQECDSLFKIWLLENTTTAFYRNTSVLSYKDKFDFPKELTPDVKNPFDVNVTSYKGPFTLLINSFDDDEHLGIDPIDKSVFEFNSTTLPPSQLIYSFTMSGQVTYVNVSIKISCDTNFYGPHCDVFCLPTDNDDGHYTCDQASGQIKCRPGWMDTKTNCTLQSISASSIIQVYSSTRLTRQSTEIPKLMTSVLKTSQITQNMLSSVTVDIKESVSIRPTKQYQTNIIKPTKESINIKPTKSEQPIPRTSQISSNSIQKTVFELILNAELTEEQINETIANLICMDVNKACYNIDAQCKTTNSVHGQINFEDINIKRLGWNSTSSHLKIEIHSANGTSTSNFPTCAQVSVLKSKRIRDLFGIEDLTICVKNGTACAHKTMNNNTVRTTEENKTGLILGIVFGLIGLILVIAALVYVKKKRLMKVQSVESERKPISNHDQVNETNTSAC